MRMIDKPKGADPWLTPREAAELMLEVRKFPRDRRVVRNEQKRIEAACREYWTGFKARSNSKASTEDLKRLPTLKGIDCDRFGDGYRFRLSELQRWVYQNAVRGQAFATALVPEKVRRALRG